MDRLAVVQMKRPRVSRRAGLAGIAMAGAGGILGLYADREMSTDSDGDSWSERAEQGIQANRTTELTVTVRNAAGNPVPEAEVSVEMQAHDFQFGTAVTAGRLLDGEMNPYRSRLLELFNTAVLKASHKWKQWEHNPEPADTATQWLLDHGLSVRGHAAIWEHLGHDVVPEDVVAKLHSDESDRASYLADRTTTHVRDITARYAGQITDWDVVNEPLHHSQIRDAIATDTTSSPLSEWFKAAGTTVPETPLYLNEYDIITGDQRQREAYEQLVSEIQRSDARIDGVGLQAHFDSRAEAIDPTEFRELLDRYASLGVSLKVTEYDTAGDDWTEQAEAAHLETVLKTLYSHPAATGFLMWGFWDGNHWRDNAPLFRDDWSAKPAYDTYRTLVFDDWWTSDSGQTDTDGQYRTDAFLGTYEITVAVDGRTTTVRRSLTDSTAETVDITLSS